MATERDLTRPAYEQTASGGTDPRAGWSRDHVIAELRHANSHLEARAEAAEREAATLREALDGLITTIDNTPTYVCDRWLSPFVARSRDLARLQPDTGPGPDDCVACRRKLDKR